MEIIDPMYQLFRDDYKVTGIAKSYVNFLTPSIAEACYRDLCHNVIFEPHQYGDLTNMQIASRPLREVYTGEIQRKEFTEDSVALDKVLEMFKSPEFIDFVSRALGEKVYFIRAATPYKFEKGNYLCFHDDMSDAHHICEVVLNLTKTWKKQYGGYSMGGYVLKRHPYKTPDEFPFLLQKIFLDKKKPNYCSLPVFNKLSILRLSDKYCHGTSKVHTDIPRFVIAVIYAGDRVQNTTTIWKDVLL